VINGFNKLDTPDGEDTYALLATNVVGIKVRADGSEYVLSDKSDRVLLKNFESLRVDRLK
jgi:hypothetical protein